MSRTLRLFLLTLVLCALSTPLFAQSTRVSGRVFWNHSLGYSNPIVTGTRVKLCYSYTGTGTCWETGIASNYTWFLDVPINQYYYLFTWNDAQYWGSPNVPAQYMIFGDGVFRTQFFSQSGVQWFLDTYSRPRPLPPNAVYPTNNATGTPLSFTLKWSDGRDGYRSSYQYVYDIYAYGDGGAELKILSNIQCTYDSSNSCTYPISGLLSSTRYNWRVVAKLNPGVPTPGDPYHTQSSITFRFTTLTDPNARYAFVAANQYNYLSASGCGGGIVNAAASTIGGCERFEIIDLNGGDINHGDQVQIRINGYYLSANNGGGSTLNANVTWGSTWETFTIRKTSGTGRILNGNAVAFQALNGQYVYSQNGGGGDVWVMGPAIGSWEPFYFSPQ